MGHPAEIVRTAFHQYLSVGFIGNLLKICGLSAGISSLIGGKQIFSVGGEADGAETCSVEHVADRISFFRIGGSRDNSLFFRIERNFQGAGFIAFG